MEHLKTLQQEAPKWFRKQEIIKLRTEIQKEKRKTKKKCKEMKQRVCFLRKSIRKKTFIQTNQEAEINYPN